MKVEYRKIEGFPNFFACNDGSIWKLVNDSLSPVQTHPKGAKGRLVVNLVDDATGRRQKSFVHLLILDAFVSKRHPRTHGKHKDGNVRNNRVGNLAWSNPMAADLKTITHRTPREKAKAGKITMDLKGTKLADRHFFGPFTCYAMGG